MPWTKKANSAGDPTLVSALPTSPVNGQVVYYQSSAASTGGNENGTAKSMADLGMTWCFRYNASSSSSYKWETIGWNAPIRHWQTGTHGGSWNYVTVIGNDITIPFNGDYYISGKAKCAGGGGWDTQFKACLSSSDSPLTGTDDAQVSQGSSLTAPWVTSGRANGLTKNSVIQLKIGSGGGNWSASMRELLVAPIRVSA